MSLLVKLRPSGAWRVGPDSGDRLRVGRILHSDTLYSALSRAFLELGELMVDDALMRHESCGGHFRLESQTEEGEAKRDDENFCFVSAWELKGESNWELHKEPLIFEVAHPSQRSYK